MGAAKKLYDNLVQTGELQEIFEQCKFSGDWNKDKKKFTEIYEEEQKLISDFDIIIEDSLEDDFISDD